MNILLIDDDFDDREFFCEALDALDINIYCTTSPDGYKALMELEKTAIPFPDVIFLDINMPSIDGWKCLSLLKANDRFKEIPVVMYSTSSYPEDIDKARQMGAFCYFSKPPSFKALKLQLHAFFSVVTNGSRISETAAPAWFTLLNN